MARCTESCRSPVSAKDSRQFFLDINASRDVHLKGCLGAKQHLAERSCFHCQLTRVDKPTSKRWQGAHLAAASKESDFGVGGPESGTGGSDIRSGSSVSGRPGVCRRHCRPALMKHVFPAPGGGDEARQTTAAVAYKRLACDR